MNNRFAFSVIIALLSFTSAMAQSDMLSLADPSQLPPAPKNAIAYPSRAADLDILPHFVTPPAGYGEVPFWWWSGDPLDKQRLEWQIEKLHEMGISGMQVNYAHKDTENPHWPTLPNTPAIFSSQWWDFYSHASQAAGKYDMGIGLSTYTLDWHQSQNLFNEIIYNDPEFNARTLRGRHIRTVKKGDSVTLTPSGNCVMQRLYPSDKTPSSAVSGTFTAEKDAQIWEFTWSSTPGTLNPVHPGAGARVIEKFFQPFEDHNGKSSKGLNYFFNDELFLGVGKMAWYDDFAQQFKNLKGYDLWDFAPALFTDWGDITPKIRMDYADVQMFLTEQRYFKPIYLWHYTRGMTYGCDNNGRGMNPAEYGDYFRAIRWYSAPGHDTPGGKADFIKGKVSSSVSNLYQRPRVWLEGYHSLGWGATPDRIMSATNENYVYGCTLLNLHGLYYTTHGSYWEWAPPCFHFRMPYWKHMGAFLKYFERLSYVLSQGTLQCDIAIMYPVSPSMAGLGKNQNDATQAAFSTARQIYSTGRDIVFMDDQSIMRAKVKPAQNGAPAKLCVSGIEFSVFVLPSVEAIRWDVLTKLNEFSAAGGTVVCIGNKPTISDRAGANDSELNALVSQIKWTQWNNQVIAQFPQDVKGKQAAKYLHRKIGARDVYFLTDVSNGNELSFRTLGVPSRWDAMTGKIIPLKVTAQQDGYTTVAMEHQYNQAVLVVFQPGKPEIVSAEKAAPKSMETLALTGAWDFKLVPTMDNRWGDFRLPVTPDNRVIGAEARRFSYSQTPLEGNSITPETLAKLESLPQERITYGFGQQFRLDAIDTNVSVDINKLPSADSKAYSFSWQLGIEGDPGHQGWHGLKKNISDGFIVLGTPRNGKNVKLYGDENPAKRYYLSTFVSYKGTATIHKGGLLPDEVWLDGVKIPLETQTLELTGARQKLVLVYNHGGRGYWLLEKGVHQPRASQREAADIPSGENTKVGLTDKETSRTPLSMTWFDIDFVPFQPQSRQAGMYRFTAPAGLKRMILTTAPNAAAPEVYVAGKKAKVEKTPAVMKRTARYIAALDDVSVKPAQVKIAAILPDDIQSGALFPEPIILETAQGEIESLGDWSQSGLDCYSGGAIYGKTFSITPQQAQTRRMELNLGDVCATAEVRINGQAAGVMVASPWKMDITGLLKEGENRIEIEVYNTLSNHYQTIPTNYRGSNKSGLIGPVTIMLEQN